MKRNLTFTRGIIIGMIVCAMAVLPAGCNRGAASPLLTTACPDATPEPGSESENGENTENGENIETEGNYPEDELGSGDGEPSDGEPDRVLFIGDSITEGLEIYNTLPGAMIQAYRGLSSYKLAEEFTLIEERKPDRIFLLIGLNDIVGIEENEPFFENYRGFIREVRRILPETELFVQSIFPISRAVEQENHNISRVLIDSFNRRLAVMAEEEEATYIDVGTRFKDEEGYLREEYTPDGIHLWSYYYKSWTDMLRPYLGSFPYPETEVQQPEESPDNTGDEPLPDLIRIDSPGGMKFYDPWD